MKVKYPVGDAGYGATDSKIFALSHGITPIIKPNFRSTTVRPPRMPSIDEILTLKPGSDTWNVIYHTARQAVKRLWSQDKIELHLGHALKLCSLDRVRIHVTTTTFLATNLLALVSLRCGYKDFIRSVKPWRFLWPEVAVE